MNYFVNFVQNESLPKAYNAIVDNYYDLAFKSNL